MQIWLVSLWRLYKISNLDLPFISISCQITNLRRKPLYLICLSISLIINLYQQPMYCFWTSSWNMDGFSVWTNNSHLRYADCRLILKCFFVYGFCFSSTLFFPTYDWIIRFLFETEPSPKLTLYPEKFDFVFTLWAISEPRKGALLFQVLTVFKGTSNLHWQWEIYDHWVGWKEILRFFILTLNYFGKSVTNDTLTNQFILYQHFFLCYLP